MTKIIQDIAFLRQISTNVDSVEEAKGIIKELENTLSPLDHGIGLAAIQIGHAKRIGVIKKSDDTYFHLINPEVLEKEDEFIYFKEGCLSFPGDYRNTKRYKQIVFNNKRIENNEFVDEKLMVYYSNDKDEMGNDGLLAIALQHELEHFEGKLIIDHNNKSEPITRNVTKIGRNDPCYCKSGLKYKKCCGK
jgi:peptide deformylase